MATYRVTFTRSGKSVECLDSKTVLEAAQEAGLDPAFSCQGGTCQTCMVKVQGDIDQEEALAIGPIEREKGYALICVGKPRGDLIVDA